MTERTDPWRFCCRLCGANGVADTEQRRDDLAAEHLMNTVCGNGGTERREAAGRLLHVWTYGVRANA